MYKGCTTSEVVFIYLFFIADKKKISYSLFGLGGESWGYGKWKCEDLRRKLRVFRLEYVRVDVRIKFIEICE